jgi:hypothetical protein
MKIEALKKKLEDEFNFSEIYEELEPEHFQPGTILLMPYYREYQRPWMTRAYNEWLNGDKTIVLVCPWKSTCMYFKRYVTDVCEIRPIRTLYCNNHKIPIPMVIAIYKKRERVLGEPNFCVVFD